jgi:sporulation protein YlmC with PRC-barrel domain
MGRGRNVVPPEHVALVFESAHSVGWCCSTSPARRQRWHKTVILMEFLQIATQSTLCDWGEPPIGGHHLVTDAVTGAQPLPWSGVDRASASDRERGSHSICRERTMADATKITSGTLIAAEKVEGTDVYNMKGEKLGTIDDIMIDKVSGKAIYAIMSFGGFLGIGEKYHPLPWSTLKYDESKGGYAVNLDKKMLENAPSYDMDEDFLWTPDYGRRVDKYYNAPTYW